MKPITERFKAWAKLNCPEWRCEYHEDEMGPICWIANDGQLAAVDPADDIASAEFRQVLEEYAMLQGYFKFTHYRPAPGLPAEAYFKGGKLKEAYGSGATVTEAYMEAVMQLGKQVPR